MINDDEWDVVETLKDMKNKKSYQDDLASSKLGKFQIKNRHILKKCRSKLKKKRLENIIKDMRNVPKKMFKKRQLSLM